VRKLECVDKTKNEEVSEGASGLNPRFRGLHEAGPLPPGVLYRDISERGQVKEAKLKEESAKETQVEGQTKTEKLRTGREV
jgi:hypothetical protein